MSRRQALDGRLVFAPVTGQPWRLFSRAIAGCNARACCAEMTEEAIAAAGARMDSLQESVRSAADAAAAAPLEQG